MKIIIEIIDGAITQLVPMDTAFAGNPINKIANIPLLQNDADFSFADKDTGPPAMNDDFNPNNEIENVTIDLNTDLSAGAAPLFP